MPKGQCEETGFDSRGERDFVKWAKDQGWRLTGRSKKGNLQFTHAETGRVTVAVGSLRRDDLVRQNKRAFEALAAVRGVDGRA
jgi:hypothetical protein